MCLGLGWADFVGAGSVGQVMALLLLGGAAVAQAAIAAMTMLQQSADPSRRGALLGAVSTLLAAAAPVGLAVAGALLPLLGLEDVLQGSGVLLLALGVWACCRGD